MLEIECGNLDNEPVTHEKCSYCGGQEDCTRDCKWEEDNWAYGECVQKSNSI